MGRNQKALGNDLDHITPEIMSQNESTRNRRQRKSSLIQVFLKNTQSFKVPFNYTVKKKKKQLVLRNILDIGYAPAHKHFIHPGREASPLMEMKTGALTMQANGIKKFHEPTVSFYMDFSPQISYLLCTLPDATPIKNKLPNLPTSLARGWYYFDTLT